MLGLGTLTWVASDAKWLETLPNAMQISQALTCAVCANAINYLAKAEGAQTTPPQALKEYGSALIFLQRDLYNSAKQTSNETLMTVLLLGIFDVQILYDCNNTNQTRHSMLKILVLGKLISTECAEL
jgi:hypothetical protein